MRIGVLMPVSVSWSREAALRLAELGHEVHVIDFKSELVGNYLNGRHELYSDGLARLERSVAAIHVMSGRHTSQLRYALYAPHLRKICRRANLDVLLALWGGGFSAIAYLSGFRPYSIFLGGGDVLRVSGWQKSFSRHALACARIVFANGDYFCRRAREFAPNASIVPLYYGVDTARFTPGSPPASPVVIVCTRGFSRTYNNSYIVEALAAMPDCLPEFRVIFTSTGELFDQTTCLADRLLSPAVRRRVEFLNGVTDNALLEHLQCAHMYTSVSRYDGTSISLLEALSCGLFPVLSDIPQNREWIDPKVRNGALAPLDQPTVYARILAEAVCDVARRERVSPFNRQLILDRADGRANMARLVSHLQNAIGQDAAAPAASGAADTLRGAHGA